MRFSAYFFLYISLIVSLPAMASSIVVDTLSNIVDGTMTSIEALIANPGSDGFISLHEAIEAANNTYGADRIEFTVAGTISPEVALPQLGDLTGGTTIDGDGLIRLDGLATPDGVNGLHITSGSNEILDLTITRFAHVGILIDGEKASKNRIAGCKIGTDGYNRFGNRAGPGIRITNNANRNLIGGTSESDRNNISANWSCGVYMDNEGNYNTIIGNYIGLSDDGISALINIGIAEPEVAFTSWGIVAIYGGSNNRIGGPAQGEGNLISANHVEGVIIISEESQNNTIQGNRFVYDESDDTDFGFDLYPYISSAIDCTSFSSKTLIGGSNPGEGNIIEGYWERFGIHIRYSNDNIVQGNILYDGPAHIEFVNRAGICADHSAGNLIGGSEEGASNTIYGRFRAVGIRMHPNNIARGNSVTANDLQAILVDGEGLAPPNTLGLSPLFGTAPACTLIDFYADEEDEARVYLGAVRTDACGRFSAAIDLSEYIGLNLTATVTDEYDWTTSELSAPIAITEEGIAATEGEVFAADPLCACPAEKHTADYDGDNAINLGELLRLIQLYNTPEGFYCDPDSENGVAPGRGPQDCAHSSDYNPRDWSLNLSELLRGIQIYNMGVYERCKGEEDGYCVSWAEGEQE